MATQGINVGGIYADLDIRTGNLDQGLAKARQALEAIAKEVKQLGQDYRDGAITIADYASRTAALSATEAQLTSRMQAAYGATTTLNTGLELVTKNANQMVHSTNRMGQGLMQLGYIADDIQYGFSGIVNNISPLVYGLGGSGGLATAAQLAAVAVHQLYIHWDQFMEEIGQGRVRTEAEEMETLAKAIHKTAEEQERYNKYKERELRIKKMMEGAPKEVGDTRNAVEGIFNEAGPGVVADQLAKAIASKPTPEQEKALAKAKATWQAMTDLYGEKSGQARKARKELDKFDEFNPEVAQKRAKVIMDAAAMPGSGGDDARQRIMSAFADPNHPLHSVAMQLQSAGPEGVAKANAAASDAAARTEAEKAAEERRLEAEKIDKEKAAAAKRDREKELGRMGFLEEQAGKGLNTKGEQAELARLLQSDTDQQRREDEQKQNAADAEAKRKEREEQQKARDNLRAGLEAAPGGTDEFAKMLAMQNVAGAITPDEARKRIMDRLKGNGATDEQATAATDKFMKDAGKDVQEGAMRRFLGDSPEMERRQNKTSQVFNANDLAANFQGSVGGQVDEVKKQTSLLEKLEKQVDLLARSGVVKFKRK